MNSIQEAIIKQFKSKIDYVIAIAIKDLQEELLATVYSREPEVYEHTHNLLNSISGNYEIKGNIIEVNVFFDPKKLKHTSAVSGTSEYDGQEIYVPSLVDEGHDDDSGVDNWYHHHPGWGFLQRSLDRVKEDLTFALGDIIKSINKTGGKKYY